MTQKNVASLLLLIALALGGPTAVKHAYDLDQVVEQSVFIDGPAEAEVGQLVTLKINGNRPSWSLPVEDYVVNGDTVIVSFREAGVYEIIGSSVAGAHTAIVKHEIIVGKKPEPDAPPQPQPGPEPTPEPDPNAVDELANQVALWALKSDAPKSTCGKLGQNFIDAAESTETLDDLLAEVAAANRKVNQKGCERVLAEIQQYLFDNLVDASYEEHRDAFSSIGKGLQNYAEAR